MRSVQRVNKKKNNKSSTSAELNGAKMIVLKPAGYPLKGIFHEYPEIAEQDVFEFYAREQWNGFVVKKGDFLFDRRMFPDFAFRIIEADPEQSVIGKDTVFTIEDYEYEIIPRITSEIKFDLIVGQEKAKQKCKIIEKFLKDPSKFGKWAPRNILFYGPAGTGKTMMAKALSNATSVPLISIKTTQLIGEFVGDGSRQIHQLYDRAEELSPAIIFMDELDAIALDRRYQEIRGDVAEIVNALLTEMDGIEERSGVCTIAATNRIESLDPAVRSRFEEEIEFSLPDQNERENILEKYAETFPQPIADDVNFTVIAKNTVGFSGRDLVEKVLKTALHQAIMEDKTVDQKLLLDVLSKAIKKSGEPPKGMFI